MKPLMFLVTLLLALAGVAASAQPIEIPLGERPNRLELLSARGGSLHFRLELGRLTAETVDTKGGRFTRLLIPGGHTSKIEGAPLLPMVNELIEIPYGAQARVEILSSSGRNIDLVALGFDKPLIPAQPSLSKSADPATVPFVHDRAAYQADKVAAPLVAVKSCGRLRGMDLGRLEISPVSYQPGQGSIRVEETIEFRIDFTGGDPLGGKNLKDKTRSPFFTPLYDQIISPAGLPDTYPDLVRDVVTLVIVTPPEFAGQLSEFLDWKTRRGFHTILAVTGTPEVGATAEEIQAYLHDLYNNATPELPAPSFVIFVGDVDQLPSWRITGMLTDRPYCSVDPGPVPDMYYGRFSATNAGQLQAILDKTLMYEQFAMPDPGYLNEAVMIAGADPEYASVWGNGQINYGTDYYFNAEHDIYSHTYLYPESVDAGEAIIQHVSDGVGYINYTAHGSEVAWYSPHFGIEDIYGLGNSGEYCLAVGNCCVTSNFNFEECFAEAWLRAPDKGAIGYIGGSGSTDWDEDFWWGVGSGNVTINPSYGATGQGAYDGLFHDHGEDLDQWYVVNDAIIFSGNLAVMEAGSDQSTYYWNIYNLMGDPSLSAWIGTPGANIVSHPAEIFLDNPVLPLQAEPGSYCGLSQDGVLMAGGSVDESGAADLQVWGEMTPGPAELVVMGQFLQPYTAAIEVVMPANVAIEPGVIEPGAPTVVTVTVTYRDAVTPQAGVEVWAEGFGYETPVAVTGADGACQLLIDYPYGPAIDICGRDPLQSWLGFREFLPVNALPQEEIALRVGTGIGLVDVFPLNLSGTLEAYSTVGGDLPDHELWGFLNDDPGQMTATGSLELTATSGGEVRGVFAQTGHDLVEAVFPVQEVFGTLSGHVEVAGAPAAGALVVGRDQSQAEVFQAICDPGGDYTIPEEILVAGYAVSVVFFGADPYEQAFFVDFGANLLNIGLQAAPVGEIGGTVRDQSTGLPLAATLKLFRQDTGEFLVEVTGDPTTGAFRFAPSPYFPYTVTARAAGHVTQSAAVLLAQELQSLDFLLEPTTADVLLIHDGTESDYSLLTDLESLGYTVQAGALNSDPETWPDYDLLVTCSGNNTATFADPGFRQNLLQYIQDGGRLLVEGGEVGFDWTYEDPAWAEAVLHASGSLGDFGGFVYVLDPAHPVMGFPNPLNILINIFYVDYGDMDILVPTDDAQMVGSWTSYMDGASVIAYNADGTPNDGDLVFFSWCYDNADAAVRVQLLENAMTWLAANGITSTGEDLPGLPAKLALRSNYPNPFNPQTTVGFDLPRAGLVELTVFDVRGRRVVTLLQKEMPAGRHDIIWQGRDHKGAQVASGVYFLRLSADSKTLTSKMLLLK